MIKSKEIHIFNIYKVLNGNGGKFCRAGYTVEACILLKSLKKLSKKSKNNGTMVQSGYFPTTLYDLARLTNLSVYSILKSIKELTKRRVIDYDSLMFDVYDESSDPVVLFKTMI